MHLIATFTFHEGRRRFSPYSWERAVQRAGKPTSDREATRFWQELHRAQFDYSIDLEVGDGTSVGELFELVTGGFELEFASSGEPRNGQGRRGPRRYTAAELLHYPGDRLIYSHPGAGGYPRDTRLSDLDIRDGDVVQALCRSAEPPPLLSIRSVRSFAQFTDRVTERAAELPGGGAKPYIHGALLYTDEDAELATFVRTYFASLSELSGQYLRIYVVERPSLAAGLGYWRGRLTTEVLQIMGMTGLLDHVPYDRAHSYRIAAELGVDPATMPCLVLFDSLEREHKLVFPIGEVSPRFFRTLFGELERAIAVWRDDPPVPEDQYGDRYSAFARRPRVVGAGRGGPADAFASVTDSYAYLLRAIQLSASGPAPAPTYTFHGYTLFVSDRTGPAMSESYTFNADATVINQPSNTVIRDFQNKYPGSADAGSAELLQEIGKLVALIAASKELGKGDREDSLRALDALAGEVQQGSTDRLSVKGRLQAIKEITSKAADIATPALGTIAVILKAFGLSQ